MGYMLSYEYNGSVFFGKMFVSRKTVYTPFELEVVTEPSDGGVANGSGTYLFGERAHLTATANENYLFVGWTNQDGDTISTDSDYAHMVARGGQITAHFVNDDGIEETRKHNMTVFPNPGNNSITISTALPNARVEIYDLTGKLVYNQEITDNVTSINTENWPSGMYFWKVVFGTSTGSVTEAECGKWIKK